MAHNAKAMRLLEKRKENSPQRRDHDLEVQR